MGKKIINTIIFVIDAKKTFKKLIKNIVLKINSYPAKCFTKEIRLNILVKIAHQMLKQMEKCYFK